jgi:uncharacterized protein
MSMPLKRTVQLFLCLIALLAIDAGQCLSWDSIAESRKAAEKGDAEAQNNLGVAYATGDGVTQNFDEAVKWFRKAAERGNANAQANLGVAYDKGDGVPLDRSEAAKWFRKAAEQGHATSQIALGLAYAYGRGVAKNPAETAKWYRKAAIQGHVLAQIFLAKAYRGGDVVPKDEIEALAWFYIAAASVDKKKGNSIEIRGINDLETLEKEIGPRASLSAQQRSKEILKEIESSKKLNAATNKGNKKDSDMPRHSGTGFFVADDGVILTAAHVVKNAKKILVFTDQGLKIEARLIKVDTANDIALLKCDGRQQPAPTRPSQGIKLGQSVFTIGFPNLDLQGSSPKMTKGEISSLSGFRDDPRQWQISVPVQPGNSGGPLFDEAGNVVGIVLSKLDAIKAAKTSGDIPQNVNYALKSAYILPMLESCGVKPTPARSHSPQEKTESVVERAHGSVVLILAE